jgi:hypothetical protein
MNTSLDARLNTLFVKVERVLLENSSLKNEKIILENEILELKSQLLSVKNGKNN